MNKKTYEGLIDENIEFAKKHLPDSLEKDHILQILKASAEMEYPEQRQETRPHETFDIIHGLLPDS